MQYHLEPCHHSWGQRDYSLERCRRSRERRQYSLEPGHRSGERSLRSGDQRERSGERAARSSPPQNGTSEILVADGPSTRAPGAGRTTAATRQAAKASGWLLVVEVTLVSLGIRVAGLRVRSPRSMWL